MTHDVTIRSDDEFGVGIACRMVRERARADGGTTSHEPPPPSIVEWSTSTHNEKFHDILTVLYSLLSSYEKNEKMQSTEEEEKKEKEKEKGQPEGMIPLTTLVRRRLARTIAMIPTAAPLVNLLVDRSFSGKKVDALTLHLVERFTT